MLNNKLFNKAFKTNSSLLFLFFNHISIHFSHVLKNYRTLFKILFFVTCITYIIELLFDNKYIHTK